MLGLVILFFAALYLLLSALVVWISVRLARKKGIKGWKFGLPAALIMYLIVFWDHIPTLLLHKYYCETEAGFWIYKTPDQWAKENPGVLETLKPWPSSKIYGKDKVEFELSGGIVTQYNDKFGLWRLRDASSNKLMIDRHGWGIVDTQTKHYLSKSVDFSTGPHGAGIAWKSWLNHYVCNDERAVKNAQIARKHAKQLQIKE